MIAVVPTEVRADNDQEVTLSTQDSTPRSTEDCDRPSTSAIAAQLAQRIGPDRFELWFSEPSCIRRTSREKFRHCISVFAESSFSLKRIQNTFGRDIRTVVDRVCGPHFQIDYCVETQSDDANCARSPNNLLNPDSLVRKPNAATQSRLKFAADELGTDQENDPVRSNHLFPMRGSTVAGQTSSAVPAVPEPAKRRRNLQSFWFGESNRFAKASVDQLFERPGQFSPFFVYGPTGCGKSHLLESIVNDFRSKLRLRRCVMLSAEQFTSLFVSSLRGGSGLPSFRRKYRDLDLLVIDDIQFFAGKRATVSEFQHTIDNLARIGKQVIVSSDRSPVELNTLGGDLSTRLSAGLSCPLRYPEYEGRVRIARQMCTERNLNLSVKVIELICERLQRDVRRISGALNRLHALAISTGARITVEKAQQELSDLFSMSSGNSTSLLSIEAAVCEYCGVKPADLKSSRRHKPINTARMLAMYLSRQYTAAALSEIGDYYGGRSHSTVIAAQKKVSSWLEQNSGVSLPHATCSIKDVIGRLESNLRIG